MPQKITLSELIDQQIARYQLPNDLQTKRKIRKKFVHTLKTDYHFTSDKVWENAEKIKVGKTEARVFDQKVISQLLSCSQDYFEKLAHQGNTLSRKEIKKIAYQNALRLNGQETYDIDEVTEFKENVDDTIRKFKMNAVIDYLFDKYFTPIEKKKLESEMAYYLGSDSLDLTLDEKAIKISNYLEHPEGRYFKRKSN